MNDYKNSSSNNSRGNSRVDKKSKQKDYIRRGMERLSVFDGGHARNDSSRDLLENFKVKPLELEKYLRKYVVNQDSSIQSISTKVCTHFNRLRYDSEQHKDHPIKGGVKNNILLIGPTGVGKTFIVRLIAEKLRVPFSKGDATKYSETGFIGGDVDDLIRNLYYSSDNDLFMAERGIVYIDEIDKIAAPGGSKGNTSEVSRNAVQRTLLKIMEDSDIELKTSHDVVSQMESAVQIQKTGKAIRKKINTKNILFVFSGAFDMLDDVIRRRLNQKVIGFSSRSSRSVSQSKSEIYKQVTPEDLVKYGFESEFVGRVPLLVVLNELDEKSLYKILKSDNSSIIEGKKRDFESYGIELSFNDSALKYIAKKASSEKTGARSLVRIIENMLIDFERVLPSSNVDSLRVTKKMVEDPKEEFDRLIKKEKLTDLL